MNSVIRRIAALGAVAVALVAGYSAAASSASAGTAGTAHPVHQARPAYVIPRCGTLDLKVSLGDWNGGVGHFYANLKFTNTGRYTCHLYGYPGVSAVDGRGKRLGPAASRRNDAPARYVNIAPGRSAHAVLSYVQALDYDPAACKPAMAKNLKVFPPADRYSEMVRFGADVCTTKTDVLSVGRVQPGA